MAKRVKRESDAIKFGGYAIAGIALALMLKNGSSEKVAPVILDYGGGFSFPQFQFDVPDWQFPYTGGVTGGVPNITIELPGDNQPIEFPALTGENNIVPENVLTGGEKTQSIVQTDFFNKFITDLAGGIAGAPYQVLGGKVPLTEKVYETFASGGSALANASPEFSYAAVSTGYGLGSAITKTAINIVQAGEKMAIAPAAEAISGAIEKRSLTGIAKAAAQPLSREAAIGLGIGLGGIGVAISSGVAVASIAGYAQEQTPGSQVALGTSAGLVGLDALGYATAGKVVPALGGSALAGGIPFVAAGIGGVLLGEKLDTMLETDGILGFKLDPNRPGLFDPKFFGSSPVKQAPINVIQDTQSMRINPGPIDGQAFGTPDLKLGDFEANTANLGPTPIYSSTVQSKPVVNISENSSSGSTNYSSVQYSSGGKFKVKNSPLKPKPQAPINPAKIVFYGWSK